MGWTEIAKTKTLRKAYNEVQSPKLCYFCEPIKTSCEKRTLHLIHHFGGI